MKCIGFQPFGDIAVPRVRSLLRNAYPLLLSWEWSQCSSSGFRFPPFPTYDNIAPLHPLDHGVVTIGFDLVNEI